ncbi:MAG: molybdate ABC transporter substrate-binding protein [Fuerstiella sp.]|nr:molybdate ABC transporter substrate-binding protein [Fuerstiella sp.]
MWALLLGAFTLICVLIFLMRLGPENRNSDQDTLIVFAAAGMRVPMEEIARQYETEFGVTLEIQYNGSNTLLNQLQTNQFNEADVYLAADDFYTAKAIELGLAIDTMPIAHQRPVIAVRRDSGPKIDSFDDLLRDEVRVAVANPDQAAVGKATRRQLSPLQVGGTSLWDQLEKHVRQSGVFKPTVNDIATDVKLGNIDAAIVWNSTVAMPKYREDLTSVSLPELDGDPDLISIAVLHSSSDLSSAYRFARYVSARDKGLAVFTKYGTEAVDGDIWSEVPQINFFCGAVNRRTTEEIIDEFQVQEGVVVNTIYDGCGILTSRMQGIDGQSPALGFPDVYMACDLHYLENVKNWFQEAANVSDVDLVIAVPKGSTKVRTLSDLLNPDIRVAVGEPSQCTIGTLTRRLLKTEGIYDRFVKKQQSDQVTVIEKSSSAHLVPDVVTGHVDAAIAYFSDVLPNQDSIDVIRIESPVNMAIQPISIAKKSEHKYLLRRLFKRIEKSPESFESAGFGFRLGGSAKSDIESLAP